MIVVEQRLRGLEFDFWGASGADMCHHTTHTWSTWKDMIDHQTNHSSGRDVGSICLAAGKGPPLGDCVHITISPSSVGDDFS